MSLANQKNTDASIKGLETQVCQMAQQMAQATQQGGAFTANTQPIPKEHCKAITTRSGKVIGEWVGDDIEVERKIVGEFEEEDDVVELEKEGELENKGDLLENEKNEKTKVVEKDEMERKKKKTEKKVAAQHLPYPHAPSKKDKERKYSRFLELFKKLKIDIPFSEALEQMPAYAKFMKDILSKKRRLNSEEVIQLDANCSAIIQRRLPKKEQDPGRVILPVAIGTTNVGQALLDLGSSINLMPLSVVKRVGDLCIKRTRMTLQLADKSLAKPLGMAEDVLVKVDKFVFPTDFVVMDIKEDEDVPIFMGRNFMQTARMMIDLDDNIMKVKVDNEEVTFNIRETIKALKRQGRML